MFINRTQELRRLKEIFNHAKSHSQMTFMVGRRRVGKTRLMTHFLQKEKARTVYFYVSRKRSTLLLDEFAQKLKKAGLLIGSLADWEEFFATIIAAAKKKHLAFIFDEFQNFLSVEPSIYSIFQKYWDLNFEKEKLNWFFIGSIQSLMEKIFTSTKEPLFKRANNRLTVLPFTGAEVKKMLASQRKAAGAEDLVNFYSVFGGIPWYYHLISANKMEKQDFWDIISKFFLEKDAILRNEAKEILIEEFGSEHVTFFAILEAIANGHTRVNQMAVKLDMATTALPQYLAELEGKYHLIKKKQPLYSKPKSSSCYFIADQLMAFWLRFIYPNLSFLEAGENSYVFSQIKNNFSYFRGYIFEEMVRESLRCRGEYTEIGGWWDRKGHEIDVLAYDREKDRVLFGECKTSVDKITIAVAQKLLEKARLAPRNQASHKKFVLFSLKKIALVRARAIFAKTGVECRTLNY